MHLRPATKYLLSALISVWTFSFLRAQPDSTAKQNKYQVVNKYHTEYSRYFEFEPFLRNQPNERQLRNDLDSLIAKPKSLWKRKDSLTFAKTALKLEQFDISLQFFRGLTIDPEKEFNDNIDYFISLYVNNEFKEGVDKFKSDYPKIITYSELYCLKKIFEAQDSMSQNPHWIRDNGNVFEFNMEPELAGIKKNSHDYKNKVLDPLTNAESILRKLVLVKSENDVILARCFNDMGLLLEQDVSYSQAYIAFNIGRTYNKKDKEISENISRVKVELSERHYKIPNFRKYFPKEKKININYDLIKKKFEETYVDTIPKVIPELKKESEPKINLPFKVEYLFLAGLLIIIVLVIVFLKPKK